MSDLAPPAPPSDDDLMTPGQVAALCGLDVATIRRYARAGKLPALRTPGGERRIRRADAMAVLRPEHPAEAS